MLQNKIKLEQFSHIIIVLSFILLFGVISMAYGYFENNMYCAYVGLAITLTTSYAIILKTVFIKQYWNNYRVAKRK
jgi:hypothetical protein